MRAQSTFRVEKRNAPRAFLNDVYYRLLRLRWRFLLLEAFLFFSLVNLAFGALYYVFRDGLRPQGLGFFDCFFFSVHTFSTVGYGSISPASLPVHLIAATEVFCGMLAMAMLTGLCFSKFSRPSGRFLFSRHLLVTNHRGKRAILIRAANSRTNVIMDAEIGLTVMYDETTPEGIYYRRLEDLPLERSRTPIFLLSMTCAHYIEPGGRTEMFLERVKKGEDVEFLVSVRGLDETFGQVIHDTQVYEPDSVVWDKQFEDILVDGEDGVRVIDFANFHRLKD